MAQTALATAVLAVIAAAYTGVLAAGATCSKSPEPVTLSAWESSLGSGHINATLVCQHITDASFMAPSTAAFAQPVFTQLALSPAAAGQPPPLSMQNVTLETDCATVQQYQRYVCSIGSSAELAGAVEILSPYWIYIFTWRSGTTASEAVNMTCVPPADAASSSPASPPCLATGITTGTALLAAVDWMQRMQGPPASQVLPVLIVLRQHIVFTEADVVPHWPLGLALSSNLTIASPLSSYFVLDWNDKVNVFYLTSQPHTYLTLFGLMMVNLPVYFYPNVALRLHLFGMLQSSLWFVNRRSVGPPQLTLRSSTLVIAYDSFAFWVFWLNLKNSPDPSLVALASWTTLMPINLNDAASGHLVLADTYAPLTTWLNMSMANPMVYTVTATQIGLPLATDNFNIPITALFQVSSTRDILVAVNKTIGDIWTRQYGQYIIFRANVSGDAVVSMLPKPSSSYIAVPIKAGPGGIPPAAPPPPPPPPDSTLSNNLTLPAVLQVPTTLTTWPHICACWDMQQATHLISFQDITPITVRNLSLLNLPLYNAVGAEDTRSLVSGLWAFSLSVDSAADGAHITLVNLTMHVPTAELQLYFSAASLPPPDAAPDYLNLSSRGRSIMSSWITQSTVVSSGAHWLFYSSLVTARFKGTNVNLTDGLPWACTDFAAMPVSTRYDTFTTEPAETSGSFPAWAIGLIVGLCVAAVVMVGATAFFIMAGRQDALKGGPHSHSSLRALILGSSKSAAQPPSPLSPPAIGSSSEHGLPSDVFTKTETASSAGMYRGAGSRGSGAHQMLDSFSNAFDGGNMIDAGSSTDSKHVDPETLFNRLARKNSGLPDEQLEIMGVLGRGGFGIVYKGRWKGLMVAAKVMIVHEENHESAHSQMLEAMISTSLSHTNIVSTYKYDLKRLRSTPDAISFPSMAKPGGANGNSVELCGASAWQLLILQELCVGGTLRQMIDTDALSVEQYGSTVRAPILSHILQLALDIALGLQHLHSKNIVHADLTPKNVLLQAVPTPRAEGLKWQAKVADFGLSVACEAGRSHVSRRFAGTPFYIAPETQHEGIVSKQSDVFALGILLSEMMMGPIKYSTKQRAKLSRPSSEDLTACLHVPPADQDRTPSTCDGSAALSAVPSAATASAATTSVEATPHDGVPATSLDAIPHNGSGPSPPVPVQRRGAAANSATGSAANGNSAAGITNGATAATVVVSMGADERPPSSTHSSVMMGAMRAASQPLPGSCPPQYAALINECLSSMPYRRPSIAAVVQVLRQLVFDYGGGGSGILVGSGAISSEISVSSGSGIGSAGPSQLPTLSE